MFPLRDVACEFNDFHEARGQRTRRKTERPPDVAAGRNVRGAKILTGPLILSAMVAADRTRIGFYDCAALIDENQCHATLYW